MKLKIDSRREFRKMFIGRDDKEKIELLNSVLGTSHRSKPYNLLNPDDLIELIEVVTAEYIDFRYYWMTISSINSDFDESIETFYPAKWMNMALKGSTDDEIDEVITAVNYAEHAMEKLMDNSEEKCVNLWRLILQSDFKEVKEHFFNENIEVNQERLDYTLDEGLIYLFEDFNYTGNVQQSTREFVRFLKKHLGTPENENEN